MTAAASEPIKVCLTNKGEDTETPWAQDLGPVPNGPPGARKVRLLNVPFMHAKPTWGDVIVVNPVPNGLLTWDRDGIAWKQIATRIVEDSGRWAMIVDYAPFPGLSDDDAITSLARACNAEDVVCEGAWAPRDAEPGRAYLAVQKELNAEAVMVMLQAAGLSMQLIQIHPEPKKLPRAQTVVGVTSAKPRKPAAESPKAPPLRSAKATTSEATSPKPNAAPVKSAATAAKRAASSSAAPSKPAAKAKASSSKPAAKSTAPAKKPAKKAAPAKKPVAKKVAPAKKPAAKTRPKKR